MPVPAHLTMRLEFEFASLGDTKAFLENLQTQLEQDGEEGYICMTGSDTAWILANEFVEAAGNETVQFVCPAQDERFNPIQTNEFVAEAHIYNQTLADEYKAFHEYVNRYKNENLNRAEKLQAVDDAIAHIQEKMDEGKIPKVEFELHHAKNNGSAALEFIDKYNFINRHARKFGRDYRPEGTHILTLSVGATGNKDSFQDFIAPFSPSPIS